MYVFTYCAIFPHTLLCMNFELKLFFKPMQFGKNAFDALHAS